MSTPTVEAVRAALADVAHDATALEVFGGDTDAPGLPSTGQRRRATRRGKPDPVHRAALILNPYGVLEWHFDTPQAPGAVRGRRASTGLEVDIPEGDLVDVFEFETLDANSVGHFLEKADTRLNSALKHKGRLWRLAAPAGPKQLPIPSLVTSPLKGASRRLLLVHGTFSRSQALIDGIGKAKNGAEFFKSAFKSYEEVLVFEHPTLSVSPVLNALDLQRELAGIKGPLDIVAHSRGGLVTRWMLEAFGIPATKVRAVLVGSPLGGTSLASPPRLKATLGLLSNVGTVLKGAGALASSYTPFLIAPLALIKVATSVIGVAATTPMLDATIAMIPGLAAQSRVGNNPELLRLRSMSSRPHVEYFVVSSDFQPEDPGWKFWDWFRGKRVANAAVDKIFPGQNDLVVDTASMSDIPGKIAARREFGTNAVVHHTNYFEQTRTLSFIMETLKMK